MWKVGIKTCSASWKEKGIVIMKIIYKYLKKNPFTFFSSFSKIMGKINMFYDVFW